MHTSQFGQLFLGTVALILFLALIIGYFDGAESPVHGVVMNFMIRLIVVAILVMTGAALGLVDNACQSVPNVHAAAH